MTLLRLAPCLLRLAACAGDVDENCNGVADDADPTVSDPVQ